VKRTSLILAVAGHGGVAFVARDFGVTAFEREIALGMIETDLVPARHGVAQLASVSGHQLVDLPPVRVFVTGLATRGSKHETERR
jgi:hypothetical protein